MANNQPTNREWRPLYDAAMRVKELAPWTWMEEMNLFGVQSPETGTLGYVSIMGMLGEHLSVAVYQGTKGLHGFWTMEELGPDAPMELFFETPQLQASFEDRNQLAKEDRAVIKALDLKFRGRQAWPMFRSHRPGFMPWFLEADEARFLTHVLEQVLDVAPRFRDGPSLLDAPDGSSYLVRVARQEAGTLVWEDRFLQVEAVESTIDIHVDIGSAAMRRLEHTTRTVASLEIDLFMLPGGIGSRGTRPQMGYVLLMVEGQTGMVLGSDVLAVDTTLEAMWSLVPGKIVASLAVVGIATQKILVRSQLLHQLLLPLTRKLRMPIELAPLLPALDEAREFMLQSFWR